MNSSSFPADPGAFLVADASVVINFNATMRAAEIIRALPNPLVVTEHTFNELKNGASSGHDDAEKLQALMAAGVVRVVRLGDKGNSIYASLIEGSALRTLDDGEAATIGCAHENGGAAVIDERKGRSICADRFPGLLIASTVDLLTHNNIESTLGPQGQIDAIISALRVGRMRVPQHQIQKVVGLIGLERAASCPSLPRANRETPHKY